MKVKKFFPIFILLFIWASIAFARTADPKRLPKVNPLRPPSQNAAPNYQGSIDYTSEPAWEQASNGPDAEPAAGENQENPSGQSFESAAPVSGKASSNAWRGWVVLIVLVGVAGGLIFKYRKS